MYTHAKREAELLKAQKQTEKRKKRAMTAEEENEEQRRDFLQQQAKKDSIILNQQETIDSLQILLSQEHHPDTIYIPTHKDFE